MLELAAVQDARSRIRDQVHRTPIFTSSYLSRLTGAEVYLKAELFQKTGSFKPRGVINKLRRLTPEEKRRGIVTVSAGNHAQATAYACGRENISCCVVMPSSAPEIKLQATRGYGATVILHDDMRTIFERCAEVLKERNALMLHPFDDWDVIAGQGTVGLEIHEDVPDADIVVVGIGGGGLISGVAVALKGLHPGVRVIGVEPDGAPSMHRALQAGKPVRLEKIDTIADGLSAPYVTEKTLETVRRHVDDVILVSDQEIVAAVRILLERAKLLVEPAGAAGTAALMTGKLQAAGKKVVLLLSGGNLDLLRLKALL